MVAGGNTKCKEAVPVSKQFSVLLQAAKISLRLFQNFASINDEEFLAPFYIPLQRHFI